MLTAGQVLDKEFLEVRCMLVEIAAMLDRHDHAVGRDSNGQPGIDPRLEKIYASLEMLVDRQASPDRAERLLNAFSDLD